MTNQSEIAERAAREIRRHFDEDFDTTIPGEVFDRELVQIVERAIAESQAPTVTLSQGGCSGTMPVYGAELGDGEPSPPPREVRVRIDGKGTARGHLFEVRCYEHQQANVKSLWDERTECYVPFCEYCGLIARSGAAQEVSPPTESAK